MTTTPPEAPSGPGPQEGPRVTRDEVRDLGRLRRSTTDRKIAGVAGGLGRHLDVDPLLMRVVLVVLVFFGGAGLIVYGACWLLVPEDDGSEPAISLDERSRTVALIVVGVLAAVALVGDSWGFIGFPWPVVVIGAIVLVVLARTGKETPPPAPYTGPMWSPGAPPYAAPPPGYTPPAGTPPYAGPPPYAATAPYASPPYVATPTYVPPAPAARPVYVPARDPRKRGPLLFWPTIALIALAEGLLGLADLAGAGVADAAYPALALGLIGLMLLVGAFYGRAGGLILLGLIAAVGTVGATAQDRFDSERITQRPQLAADLDPSYRYGAGELVIDLTGIQDLAALDGRTLELDVSVGRIEVLVPEGLAVDAVAAAHGPGAIDLFGDVRDGIDTTASQRYDPPGLGDHPELSIDAEINLGEIEVRTR